MNAPNAMYQIEQRDGVYVLSFRRNLFDPASIEAMRVEVRGLIATEAGLRLVIDCTQLRQVSSMFLGALLEITLKLRGGGKKQGLRLCGMTPQVREVFGVMRLDEAVQIHATVEGAVGSFEAPRA